MSYNVHFIPYHYTMFTYSYNSSENAVSLPIMYVVPRSFTLTWRTAKRGNPHGMLSPLSWKGLQVYPLGRKRDSKDQCGFQTLDFNEDRHKKPIVLSRSKTENKLVLDGGLNCILLNKRLSGVLLLKLAPIRTRSSPTSVFLVTLPWHSGWKSFWFREASYPG